MFTADLKQIATALTFIKRATGYSASRSRSLPELCMARVDVADGQLTVGLFDYETAASATVPAVHEGGHTVSTAVKLDALATAIKSVGGKGNATFDVTIKGLRIAAGGASTIVPVFVGELPELPRLVDPTRILSVTGPAFAEAVAAVAASVGTDDTLPMLTGVRVETDPSRATVTLATTDRFKLTVAEVETNIVLADNIEMLVPGRALTAFGKAAAKQDQVEVTASIGTAAGPRNIGWVMLASDTLCVIARLLDCEFPKFRQLLPKPDDYVASLTVDATELAKRFKAMSASSRSVRLQITKQGVTASGCMSADWSNSGPTFTVDTIESRVDDDMVIEFSTEYLADLLAAAPRGTKATMSFTKPTRPAVFEYGAVKAMLMPIRIPGNDSK
ncbi:DNA polymerase III sliding clamp [Mycobacterium phage Omnicron]|uniref:DNA polymerase III sliding clamp n=1 Tax=Mycobacterium phage Omnicron TaxID=1541819 RepID=A0A088FQB7_9CAUD|nr:DNA polymerase processivity factor [Mycobacterium phage Omnicron]AIM50383.1 DNA polymerase III sliding clamp [Mycobacterium phage Omnicron]